MTETDFLEQSHEGPLDAGDPRYGGWRRPRRVSLAEALRRHWLLAAASVVLFVVLAVAAGLLRTPTYTATTSLNVTNVDLNAPGALAAYTQATQSLASAFSRTVEADAVIRPVAEELGLPPREVLLRVSGAPIPQSPIFRVIATGSTEEQAVGLSQAVSTSLVRYISERDIDQDRASSLYDKYRETALVYQRRLEVVDSARERRSQERLQRAEADVMSTELRLTTLRQLFREASTQSNQAQAAVQTPALLASSDRRSTLQLFGFVGLCAGVLTGAALALLRANLRVRRLPG